MRLENWAFLLLVLTFMGWASVRYIFGRTTERKTHFYFYRLAWRRRKKLWNVGNDPRAVMAQKYLNAMAALNDASTVRAMIDSRRGPKGENLQQYMRETPEYKIIMREVERRQKQAAANVVGLTDDDITCLSALIGKAMSGGVVAPDALLPFFHAERELIGQKPHRVLGHTQRLREEVLRLQRAVIEELQKMLNDMQTLAEPPKT